MIHLIEVENFYSIREKQVLDFRSKALKNDLNSLTRSRGKESILIPPVIGFFGPNASGKTTLLRAISSVVSLLQQSTKNELPVLGNFFQPYLSSKFETLPTKITIIFDGVFFNNGKLDDSFDTILKYEIHVSNNPNDRLKKFISYENLSYTNNSKTFRNLFERHGQEFNFTKEFTFDLVPLVEKTISKETATLGRLSIFNHSISSHLMGLVQGVISNINGIFKIINHPDDIVQYYKLKPEMLQKINQILPKFDLGIEEMGIENVNGTNHLILKHSGLSKNLMIFEESKGTQTFVELFPLLIETLENGGIAIIDELDNELHPFLIPELLSWFYDEERNPHAAQILFTAHNATLLNHLNISQIYFTEKRYKKGTDIFCAKNIEGARTDVNIMKKYLSGELGGVPIFG